MRVRVAVWILAVFAQGLARCFSAACRERVGPGAFSMQRQSLARVCVCVCGGESCVGRQESHKMQEIIEFQVRK